jgi:dihydroxyacetone kinase
MGGSSGILLAIFVAAVGASLSRGNRWPAALRDGVRRLEAAGGAQPGDRTMLDALDPAIRELERGGDIAAAARAARAGADATASMTRTIAGRASYVPAERLRGIADPGAVAVALVLERLCERG